jgi:hypothetical protein
MITSLFSSLAFEMLSHPKDTNLPDYGRVAINRDWFHISSFVNRCVCSMGSVSLFCPLHALKTAIMQVNTK